MYSGYHACLTRWSTAGSLLSRSFKIPLSSNIAVCQRSQKKKLFLLKMQTMDPLHRSDLDNFFQINSPSNKIRTACWGNNSKGY